MFVFQMRFATHISYNIEQARYMICNTLYMQLPDNYKRSSVIVTRKEESLP